MGAANMARDVYLHGNHTVRIPLTEGQADSMVLYGDDGELAPRRLLDPETGGTVYMEGEDGNLHEAWVVNWELPEGTVLEDGTDLSGRGVTTWECGPEPALTLDMPSAAGLLGYSFGALDLGSDPDFDMRLRQLADAVAGALGGKDGAVPTTPHLSLADQERAARAAVDRDDAARGDGPGLGSLGFREEDIPY